MKFFFLCPSNLKFMPYLTYYDENIKGDKAYVIWDRFNSEEAAENKFIFKDGLVRHQRNIFRYIRYLFFLYKTIMVDSDSQDKFVVFGGQLTFFLAPYLWLTKKKYVIDIRDYHVLMRFIPDKIFRKASFVAVSSPRYKNIFSEKVDVVVSHNFYNYSMHSFNGYRGLSKPISVSCIGAIRNLKSQKDLITQLLNNNHFVVNYHGGGDILPAIKAYADLCGAENVNFTGEYNKDDEFRFYEASTFVNMLRESSSFNERVALPNRLYSAAFFYRPALCYEGSLLADMVKRYSLGLCLNSSEGIDVQMLNYFEDFSYDVFKRNCDMFLLAVKEDQEFFNEKLKLFNI